jgi:hypothetical protein
MSKRIYRNHPAVYQVHDDIDTHRIYDFTIINSYRFIDPYIGRNNMLALLRLQGILTVNNMPKQGTRWTRFFITYFDSYPDSRSYYSKKFLISGEGIKALRELIESIRINGGSI